VTIAVGESTLATDETSGEADSAGVLVGLGVGEEEGSGVGEVAGSGVGEEVGSGGCGADGASTVPTIGLSRSSASERGVTIKTQRITRPTIAFLIVDSGFLAMSARVMMMWKMNFFGRVLTEQSGAQKGVP
jgi:hypothetical protein